MPGGSNPSLPKRLGGRSFTGIGVNSVKGIPGGNKGMMGSYADAVSKGQVSGASKGGQAVLNFQADKTMKDRLEKAYVGRVCIPGSSYNIQNYLEMEGVFAIKATPIGGNSCLLEELEEGFIGDLIKEGETWWQSLFYSIEKWKVGMLDGRRDVWFRVFGIPLHAWCPDFFVAFGEIWGRFICMDENTSKGEVFDVARILVNIPISLTIPEVVSVCIDGLNYNLCIREDAQSFIKHVGDKQKDLSSSEEVSSDSDNERLVMESDSGCSIEAEGREVKEWGNSDGVIKSLSGHHGARRSGDFIEDDVSGKPVVCSDADPSGNCIRYVSSGNNQPVDVPYGEDLAVLAVGDSNLKAFGSTNGISQSASVASSNHAVPASSNIFIRDGCYFRDSELEVGEENLKVSSSKSRCSLSASEATAKVDISSSANSLVRKDCPIRKAVSGNSKEKYSECGPNGGNSYPFNTVDSVGVHLANFRKGSRVRSPPEHSEHSEHVRFCAAESDSCSTHDTVAGPFLESDKPEANMDKAIETDGNRSAYSSGNLVKFNEGNCFQEGECIGDPKHIPVCAFSSKLEEDCQNGGEGGRKRINKIFLSGVQSLGRKRRIKAKNAVGSISIGAMTTAQLRGSSSSSTCYGQQSEESDIHRNNERQWNFFEKRSG